MAILHTITHPAGFAWPMGGVVFNTVPTTLRAETFAGASFSLIDSLTAAGESIDGYWSVYAENDRVFVACGTDGLRVYDWDGSNFTFVEDDSSYEIYNVTGDGTYIYTTGVGDMIYGYSYNFGTDTLTEEGSLDHGYTPFLDVWPDISAVSGDVFMNSGTVSGIIAFNFDGSTFTELDDVYPGSGFPYEVFAISGEVYGAFQSAGLYVYTWNGSAFSYVDDVYPGDWVRGVWVEDSYIYLACDARGIYVYQLIGGTLTYVDSNTVGTLADVVVADGDYIWLFESAGSSYIFGQLHPEPPSEVGQVMIVQRQIAG